MTPLIHHLASAIGDSFGGIPVEEIVKTHRWRFGRSRARMALVYVLRTEFDFTWAKIGGFVGLSDPSQAYRAALKRKADRDRAMIAACWAGERAAREWRKEKAA